VLATFGIQNQQNLVLGALVSSLNVAVSTPISTFQQCGAQSVTINNLTVSELWNTSFKSASSAANSTPGQWYQNGVNSESQTVLTSSGFTNSTTATPGLADSGTRIRVNFPFIPGGVTVTMPVTVNSGAGQLVANAGGDLGPFSAASGAGIPLTTTGSVTYEVRSQNPGAIDSFNIPITVSSLGGPAAGSILVSATYAPTISETSNAVPRFADTSVLVPVFHINSCLPPTNLIFVVQPVNGIAGTPLPAVVVNELDVFGNVTSSNSPVTVTSSPSGVSMTVNASGGVATFNGLNFGSPGTYTLNASASGVAGVASQSFIIRGPTSISLSTSLNPVRYGQNVILTAAVSPSSATGLVEFLDGTTFLGTATLSGGQAQLNTPLLASGIRSLRARYAGNGTYVPSTSPAFSETVNVIAGNTFQAPANIGSLNGPDAIAVADLNGDTIPDIVAANYLGNSASVMLGKGNGTFQPAVSYATGGQPIAIAVGDFNSDGKPDLAVANYLEGTVSLLLNKGDGTFPTSLKIAVGVSPSSLAVGDFNNDGVPDLVVVNFANNSSNVAVLLGNGDGTFQTPSYLGAGAGPFSVAVGDLNNDGNADIVVANANENDVTVFLGNGNGAFQSPQFAFAGTAPQSLSLADFNGDGVLDIAAASSYGNQIVVLLGKGDGSSFSYSVYPAGTNPYSIAAGDVNGDGKVDLVTANVGANSVSVLLGAGNGAFQVAMNYSVGANPEAVALGDFNNDGKVDIAVANYNSNNLGVLLGAAAGQLKFPSPVGMVVVGTSVSGVVVQVQDAAGNVNNTSSASVTLTSSLAGINATVNAVNGVATFNGLVFGVTGTYTLTATSPGLLTAMSNPFNVIPVPPSVVIDSPAPGAILANGNIVVTGWALDNTTAAGTAITNIKVFVDGTLVGTGIYGSPRNDVCAVYPGRLGCPNVGFTQAVTLLVGTHTITVSATDGDPSPDTGSASVTVTVAANMMGAKVGVFRNGVSFLEDTNGNAVYDAGVDRFITNFTGPGGFLTGDYPVVGDWTGDGHAKVGIYRSSTGKWYLDSNNNGVLDAGDLTYSFGGVAGDVPFVGDWAGLGKSCVGLFRSGFLWVLDLNCNGSFDGIAADASFPFGGISGDVPVVGAWSGGTTRVGVVRKYAPAGVPIGNPFYWVLDGSNANAGSQPANHQPGYAFAFGGLAGDAFVTGDWVTAGTSSAGVFRGGLWVLDAAIPSAPQASHVNGTIFGYGGVTGDVPVTGKW
jgi:hypothetical protein